MKIGIACYPTHGGSGVVATELGLGLNTRGHEVHFFSYTTPFRLREFRENLYFHEVDVSSYPLFKYPPYALSLAAQMAKVADQKLLDVLHVHYAVPHAISAILATQITKKCRPKIVTTLHGTDITLVDKDDSFFEIVRYSLEQSDGVTAVSEFLRKKIVTDFQINKSVRVIYNFIHTNRCSDSERYAIKTKFTENFEKLIVHASNFRPLKRVTDVVKIFDIIRQKIPSKLVLIGEGPDLPTVTRLVRKLDIEKHVLCLGTMDYFENILSCADLFLLASEQESFGLAALEAMSCGCSVIGTNTGGLPEVVVDGESGFLFPVGDIASMADKAITILLDEVALKTLKENASKRAITHFNADTIIDQYEKFYSEII